MSIENNQAGTHLIVDSLTVLKGINSSTTKTLQYNVEALASGQQALAASVSDYFSGIAADGTVTAEEKKVLYKEWKTLVQDYADLVQAAEVTYGLPASSDALIAFKAAYAALYKLVIADLKLFDNMRAATVLPDKNAFIAAYTAYYSARETLRQAIMVGEDAKVRETAESLYLDAQKSVKNASLSSLIKGSVEWEKLLEGDTNLSLLTESGGASAFFGLSTGIPYFITADRYDTWADALAGDSAGLSYLAQVYEKVNISTTDTPVYAYRFASTATEQNVKSLRNKIKALGLLASVATIDADMIQLNGTSLFTSSGTLKSSIIDWLGADSKLLELVNALSKDTTAGATVIDGGLIKTELIDVAALLAKSIVLKATGFIQSANYAEGTDGMPTAGFKLDAATGQMSAYGMKANGLEVVNGSFVNGAFVNGTFDGSMIVSDGIYFTTYVETENVTPKELAEKLCTAMQKNKIGDKRLLQGTINLRFGSSTNPNYCIICTYAQKISDTVVLIYGTMILAAASGSVTLVSYYLSSDDSNTTQPGAKYYARIML